ncbi:efflux RND transporter periplasmic adaptor subunit [Oceanibaculum sp.]|uniref:efflux RND transporter periplasmic adaptor subunit n=1 Tax=Oceanibaculum sp. TaxID=1903597 RepID=UPI00258EE7D5|nr:efflux RND transporter periplasmic adaptor subunit [Oceanibaculum sp.]MCH2395135.1 efflux RND transporter periplasmic adaptor subunit [Oceanibaculum sp.]
MSAGWKILAGLLVLAAAGGGVAYHLKAERSAAIAQSANGQTAKPAPQQNAGPPVEVAEVTVDTVRTEITAVGSLLPNEAVTIQPEISGRISRILFQDVQRVERGAPLVELDKDILQAELAQAQANLSLSKANYDRADTLLKQGTGTVRARDEAVARLRSDEAGVDLAKARLDKATIRAPFSGVLGLRSISLGRYVTPADTIVTLQQIDPLKAEFRVPEVYLTAVRVGQKIEMTADALAGQSFTGEIYAIDPQVDVNGRSLRIRALVPNPDLALSPGLFIRLTIIAETRPDAVLVPESSVTPVGQKRFVYRLVEDKAVLTEVQLGERRPGLVEVLSGLKPKDVVVVAGQLRLRDGIKVDVVGRGAPVAGTGRTAPGS